jgi:hypothetical protein
MRHSSILAAAATCVAAAPAPGTLARPDAGPSDVEFTPLAHGTIAGRLDASRAGIQSSARTGTTDFLATVPEPKGCTV